VAKRDEVVKWSGSHWAVVAGALAGALASYLLRTPRGRRLCDGVIQILDDFTFECARFCQACARAQIVASDTWKALEGNTQRHGGAR
jgi:hypothetical protein